MGFVGDSIPLQAFRPIGRLIQADRRIAFNHAGLGFEVDDVLPRVRQAMNGGDVPDIFVVFLGTAQSHSDPPAVWERELRRLLDLVSPRVDCLRVFEIDDDRTGFYTAHDRNARAYNRITRRLTERYANAEWFHYEAWAALAGPEYERPDILHHNLAGQTQVARLMRDATNSCDPALTTGPFWDVPDRHPAAAAIAWLGTNRFTLGFPNHTYRARIGTFTIDATRGDLVDMVWRVSGRPGGFPDDRWTDSGPPYEAPLRWADARRVGRGFADGTYRPRAPLTRADALGLLYRHHRLDHPAADLPDDPWADVDGAAYRWAAAESLFPAGDGTLRPGAVVSRAALARLVYAYAGPG